MPEAVSLRVPKRLAQQALALVRTLSILHDKLRLQHEDGYLHIPLKYEPSEVELEEISGNLRKFEISKYEFKEIRDQQVKLVDFLSDKVPPHVLASLPRAIDFIGDISVVEIPPELEAYKAVIGEAVLKTHRRVKTVLSKWSPVSGVYRLRTFEVIAGEDKTQTVHREHGCVFHVDLEKAYFSPRLSYEHIRIASLVREGETTIDMFSGVGSFSILIATKHTNVHVYAIDMNPDAYELLKKNTVVNRVSSKVTPVLGDARQVVDERLTGVADRVIMNLPEKAVEYVDVACKALKPDGGIIHYYQFVNTPKPTETASSRLAEAVEQQHRILYRIVQARIVRGVAPFVYQVVVDAQIK